MQNCDINAYLGDIAGEITAEQRDLIRRAADAIGANLRTTYKDDTDTEGFEDDINELAQAQFATAVRIILGDATLETVSSAEVDARATYMAAIDATTGAMIAARLMGATPTEIARATGISRVTIYKRLGSVA